MENKEAKDELNIAPTRNPTAVWNDFIELCKSGNDLVVYEEAPSSEAERLLQLYSNEEIASWFASLTIKPKHIKIAPLEKNIMEGPPGTPVYSYTVNYDSRAYYIAIFERLKNANLQQILKSLKRDTPRPQNVN